MKKLLLLVALCALMTGFDSCIEKPEPEPEDPKDLQLRLLSDTWSYKDVIIDGVRQPGYDNFKLTLAGTPGATDFGYVTTGRPVPTSWPSSGTWRFKEDFEMLITRDGNFDIAYALSSDGNTLEMSFNYQGDGFSRVSDIKGQWVFTFSRGQNSK